MLLSEHTLTGFSEVLASDAPAPGGGSASALAGAVGVALAGMVAALTAGKKKYADRDGEMRDIIARADAIRKEFLLAIDRDTEAFNAVSAVFAMPKETEEQKATRKSAMQQALKGCTLPPLGMMELSLSALELSGEVLEGFNTSAASDLGVAALQLDACAKGAWLNVLINIGGIQDEAFVAEQRAKGSGILSQCQQMAEQIYQSVLTLV